MYKVYATGKTITELKENMAALCAEMGVSNVSKVEAAITAIDTPNPSEFIEGTLANFDGEVDAENLPWDKRIHAKSKLKIADGTWKVKRNLDKEFLAEVKAGLRRHVALATNPTPIPEPPISETTPVAHKEVESPLPKHEERNWDKNKSQVDGSILHSPVITSDSSVTPQPVVVQEAVTIPAPVQTPVGNVQTLQSFTDNFPMIVSDLITKGKVTSDYINQLTQYFKVEQIWSITDAQKAEVFENFASCQLIVKG